MKKLTFLVFFLPFLLHGQFYEAPTIEGPKPEKFTYDLKRPIATISTQFAAGMFSGVGDAMLFNYNQTWLPKGSETLFGKTEQYWNPAISWRNKWRAGDPAKGEKFPLSSTALVSLTDAWHLADMLERTSMQSFVFTYTPPPKGRHRWKAQAIDFILIKLFYSAGWTAANSLMKI